MVHPRLSVLLAGIVETSCLPHEMPGLVYIHQSFEMLGAAQLHFHIPINHLLEIQAHFARLSKIKERESMRPFSSNGLRSMVVPRRCSSIFSIVRESLKPATKLPL